MKWIQTKSEPKNVGSKKKKYNALVSHHAIENNAIALKTLGMVTKKFPTPTQTC